MLRVLDRAIDVGGYRRTAAHYADALRVRLGGEAARARQHVGDALTPALQEENRAAVHGAWRLHEDNVRQALTNGFYKGWDLHPAQLPVRYAAVYAFFLEGLEAASRRLRAFLDRAAQATLLGGVFDDAATGQGLLNFFLRGIYFGAFGEDEALDTGLTVEELRGRSFVQILKNRRAGAPR